MKGVIPCGCGHCLPCKINRRRLWSHRIILELMANKGVGCFVTLTYNDKYVPCDLSLNNYDYQCFLKRLRKLVGPFRYFLAGEYGEKTNRPHYHLAIFGINAYVAGGSDGRAGAVQRAWSQVRCRFRGIPVYESMGFTTVGSLNMDSAQYIAGYVTKKYSKGNLCKRKKEFSRMSLRPGIGKVAMDIAVRSVLLQNASCWLEDAPTVLRYSGRLWPLGRYLRGKFREALGRESDTPKHVMEKFVRELSELRTENEGLQTLEEKRWDRVLGRRGASKKNYLDKTKQKILNIEALFEIYKSEKKL